MDSVDLDADPFVPEGSTVEEHLKGGRFLWALENMQVAYRRRDWRLKWYDPGFVARILESVRYQNPINANLLDHLLANQHLMPEAAKPERLYFWGTVYRLNRSHPLYVRCLRWDEKKNEWCWDWYSGDKTLWGDELCIPLLVK